MGIIQLIELQDQIKQKYEKPGSIRVGYSFECIVVLLANAEDGKNIPNDIDNVKIEKRVVGTLIW